VFRLFAPVERIGRTNAVWEALSWTGYEHLCLEEWGNGFAADGLIIAVLEDLPSRTWYRIELDENWGFRSLQLAHTVETTSPYDGPIDLNDRSRELVRTADGIWDHDLLDEFPDLSGCTDIDIAITPFTNTLPIRRLDLDVGESAEIEVVYVTVPELTLAPARQSYTRIGDAIYRFESLESGFSADITVDDRGLVTDYPALFRRVWAGSSRP
jgi:uncharacterized protein